MENRAIRIKEWMREHAKEVERVRGRYDELRELSIGQLLEMAGDLGVDLVKTKDKLIAEIFAKEKR